MDTGHHKLAQAGLKPKKCFLFKTKVLYLGHIVSANGVSTDPEKVKAMQEWGEPKDLMDVRSFLGLCSYFLVIHTTVFFIG